MSEKREKAKIILLSVFFVVLNAAIIVVLTVFPAYYRHTNIDNPMSVYCIWRVALHIYCLTCGFTRALWELLHFNIIESLRFNPTVIYMAAGTVYYYVRCIYMFVKRKIKIIHTDILIFAVGIFVAILFCVVRNILLLGFGIDLTGDFTSGI